MKVAVTGASGLIGSRVIELLSDETDFIPLRQESCDVTDKDSLWNALKDTHFDMLLHLAAYTQVDRAEEKKEAAYKLNVEATKNIVEITDKLQKKLIYFSTDFVFDGESPPYTETSTPHPISYYGQTKYEGENLVKNNGMIVRPSYPYRSAFETKKDFVRTIISLLRQKKPLTMVNDSIITPTFIDDIAYGLKYLMNNFNPDIYHLVGSDSMSPYDAGQLIAKQFDLDHTLISPVTYEAYFSGKAKRPRMSEIKSTKNTFHHMMSFEEGLKKITSEML